MPYNACISQVAVRKPTNVEGFQLQVHLSKKLVSIDDLLCSLLQLEEFRRKKAAVPAKSEAPAGGSGHRRSASCDHIVSCRLIQTGTAASSRAVPVSPLPDAAELSSFNRKDMWSKLTAMSATCPTQVWDTKLKVL